MVGKTDAQELAQWEIWQICQLQLANFLIICEIGSRNCRINSCVNFCNFGSRNCRILQFNHMPFFKERAHILDVPCRKATKSRQFFTQLFTNGVDSSLTPILLSAVSRYVPANTIVKSQLLLVDSLSSSRLGVLVFLLVIIRIVNALHKYFAIVYFVSQSTFKQRFDGSSISCALSHGCQVFLLINLTPIHA